MTDPTTPPLDNLNHHTGPPVQVTSRSVDAVCAFMNRNAGLEAAAGLLAEARIRNLPLTALWLDIVDAKRQGGNRFVLSGDEAVPGRLGVELARRELMIESVLHSALENGNLQLHYQPIICPGGRLEAVEALMRCTHHGV